MNKNPIRDKFGDDYFTNERTFIMGIDRRFTAHFAERFRNLRVLETCTGAGFSSISLVCIKHDTPAFAGWLLKKPARWPKLRRHPLIENAMQ